LADHRLMTQVHPIEISDRGHAAMVTRSHIVQAADQFHFRIMCIKKSGSITRTVTRASDARLMQGTKS